MEQLATQQAAASSQPLVQYAVAPVQMQPDYQASAVGQPSVAMPGGGYPAPGYQHLHQQQLQHFWTSQMYEIDQVNDFKNHQLPLARIKKIMKADEDVRMISAEAPVVFAKACELFILELTLRSWINTEENKRRTLQKNDIASAITRTDIFDFLVDIVPRDEIKEEGVGMPPTGLPVGALPEAIQYGGMYYMQQASLPPGGLPQPVQSMMGSPATIVGRPAVPMDPSMYMSQQGPGMPYVAQQPVQQVWHPSQFSEMSAGDPPNSLQ